MLHPASTVHKQRCSTLIASRRFSRRGPVGLTWLNRLPTRKGPLQSTAAGGHADEASIEPADAETAAQQHKLQQPHSAAHASNPDPALVHSSGCSASQHAEAAADLSKSSQGKVKQRQATRSLSLHASLVLLGHALAGCFAVIRNWLQYILVRAGVGTGALLLFMHLLLNKAVLPLVNKTALPNIVRHVEALTLREVSSGGVSSVSLAGLLGVGPLVTLQQLEVGSGPVEHSSLKAPEVTVSVLPAASMARGQLLLQLAVHRPHVRVVQGQNFSWLGYPMDTIPSSRDLLPGLRQQQQPLASESAEDNCDADVASRVAGAGGGSRARQTVDDAPGSQRPDAVSAPGADVPGSGQSPRSPPFASITPSGSTTPWSIHSQQQQHTHRQKEHVQQAQSSHNAGGVSQSSADSEVDEPHLGQQQRAPHATANTHDTLQRPGDNVNSQGQQQRVDSILHTGQLPHHQTPIQPTSSSLVLPGEVVVADPVIGVHEQQQQQSARLIQSESRPPAGVDISVDDSSSEQLSSSRPTSSRHSSEGDRDSIVSEQQHTELADAVTDVGSSSFDDDDDDSSQHINSNDHESQQVDQSTAQQVTSSSSSTNSSDLQTQPHLSQPAAAADLFRSLHAYLQHHLKHLSSVLLGGVSSAVHQVASAAAQRLSVSLQVAPPALHSVVIHQGQLDVRVHGEPLDRHLHNLDLKLTLGPQYSWMEILAEGDAAARHPASIKCTQINPNAKRHLRHVTPGAAGVGRLRRFACDNLPCGGEQTAAASNSAVADVRGSSDSDLELFQSDDSTDMLRPYPDNQLQQQTAGQSGSYRQQPHPHPESTVSTLTLPLETLHIPSGQQGVPSRVHFQLPDDVQGGADDTAAIQTDGGHLSVRVVHHWSRHLTGRDNLLVSVSGRALSAPLIERLLELPMDISSGTVDGEIHIAANDDATWEFPAITGKLTCRDVDLHFWDAPDDILGAHMDLLFERDRVYLHKATGTFGAIPLSVSGDLDLCPQAGQYRLQASVGPVEVNNLRASLGVRPIPLPVAGALRGVLHVTGPLEKPIFSGSASAVRPPPALLIGVEHTPALAALLNDPAAVAAYDRVPATAVNGVFTLDTATEMFVLHSGQAVPAGGGLVQAAGKMWVAAAAETDPRAISMEAGASGLNAAALAAHYLDTATTVQGVTGTGVNSSQSAAAVLSGVGPLNVRGSLMGSHVAPTTRLEWAAPSSSVSGNASLSPTALNMATSGPGFHLKASAVTSNPTMQQARNADTQAEATYYGTPRVEAFQVEGSVSGVDLLPLTAAATSAAPAPAPHTSPGGPPSSISDVPPAIVDGSPVRMRITGGIRVSAVRDASDAARRQAGLTATARDGKDGYLFTGPVMLDGLRVNQLQLCRSLVGDISLTEPRLVLRGRGAGRSGDELLELDLALPPVFTTAAFPGPDGFVPVSLYHPPGFDVAARQQLAAPQPAVSLSPGASASSITGQDQSSGEGGDGGGDGTDDWPDQRSPWSAVTLSAADEAARDSRAAEAQRVSHVLLRRGDLHFSSTVNGSGSVFGAALEHLPLDELELGSLRGLLVSAVLDVDLTAAAGRLSASLASPRFSGVAGTGLSANARWERDVILLERAVLTQPNSKYELAAEYILPPGVVLPGSIAEAQQTAAAAMAARDDISAGCSSTHYDSDIGQQQGHDDDHDGGGQQQQQQQQHPSHSVEGGRWRVELSVPHAVVEELLPAGQLLRQASRRSGTDYHLAKTNFLSGLSDAAITAGQEFSSEVSALAEAAASALQTPVTDLHKGSSGSIPPGAAGLPGLQELRGSWSGRLVAVGGGAAAAAPQLEFDLTGSSWKAGPYTCDQILLRGSADVVEGVNLDELKVVVGGATLSAKGCILGQQQDASFSLTDFPAVLLQPLFSALPALQHAAPALDMRGAGSGGKFSSSSSVLSSSNVFSGPASAVLSSLNSRLESSLAVLGIKLPGAMRGEDLDPLQPFRSSPVSGLLNMRGVLSGSASAPTGVLGLKLVDGALGRQRLARATANLALNRQQQLTCEVELAPAEAHGHIRLAGSIDLLGEAARSKQPAADGVVKDSSSGSSSRTSSRRKAGSSRGSKQGGKQRKPPEQPAAETADAVVVPALEPEIELAVSVKDGGVALLTGLGSEVTWGGGSAAVNVSATGPAAAPVITGSAVFNKCSVVTSMLRHPLTQLTGSVTLDGHQLTVTGLEAKVGPKGAMAVSGNLPLRHQSKLDSSGTSSRNSSSNNSSGKEAASRIERRGLAVGLSGIELRVRNMYSGSLDASLALAGSLAAPQLGGELVFSRGTAFLVPPAAAATAADASEVATSSTRELGQADLVRTAFSALKAGRVRAALDHRQQGTGRAASSTQQSHNHQAGQTTALSSPAVANSTAASGSMTSVQPQLLLTGLDLVFGPELRAVFPVVLNVGLSGHLHLTGDPFQPSGLLPRGTIHLEGGVLNLVATQFRLEREHLNTITFTPEAGLDPVLELALSSSELRAVISGRASSWQDNLSLTATGATSASAAGSSGGGGGAGGVGSGAGAVVGGAAGRDGLAGLDGFAGDPLGSRVVARVFEGRLADALLAEDGSLSLATLAGNTLGSLLPKIETQGQLGKARWRLVSAPSLPGLLSSVDPQASPSTAAGGSKSGSAADAGPRLLRSLALGTEVELALGRSLVAALSHNMPAAGSDGGGEPGTEVRLSLALSRQLRLLVQQRGLRLQPSVLLQFNSEGTPWLSTNR